MCALTPKTYLTHREALHIIYKYNIKYITEYIETTSFLAAINVARSLSLPLSFARIFRIIHSFHFIDFYDYEHFSFWFLLVFAFDATSLMHCRNEF